MLACDYKHNPIFQEANFMGLSINLVPNSYMEGSGSATIRWCNLSHASKGKKHRVTRNRNFKCSICLHCNGQVSCSFIKTVAGLIVAESVNEQTSFSSESKQEKLKMLTQLPFHKDNDFRHQHSSWKCSLCQKCLLNIGCVE